MVALKRRGYQEDHDDTAYLILPPPLAKEIPSEEIEGSSPAVEVGSIPAMGREIDGAFGTGVRLG